MRATVLAALLLTATMSASAQVGPAGQPQFSQPRPKTPRVSAGCLSQSCWYLCTMVKGHGKEMHGPSVFTMVKFDYTDGDFALDFAINLATQIGRQSIHPTTATMAYFDSVEAFTDAAKAYMSKPDVDYFITGVCRK
jgi:hypothetical protein